MVHLLSMVEPKEKKLGLKNDEIITMAVTHP